MSNKERGFPQQRVVASRPQIQNKQGRIVIRNASLDQAGAAGSRRTDKRIRVLMSVTVPLSLIESIDEYGIKLLEKENEVQRIAFEKVCAQMTKGGGPKSALLRAPKYNRSSVVERVLAAGMAALTT